MATPRIDPQVVIGMAVTRDGIPIWVWTWPGNAWALLDL